MKTLNISFDDREYEELVLAKGKELSWKEFILKKCLDKKEEKKDFIDELININDEEMLYGDKI